MFEVRIVEIHAPLDIKVELSIHCDSLNAPPPSGSFVVFSDYEERIVYGDKDDYEQGELSYEVCGRRWVYIPSLSRRQLRNLSEHDGRTLTEFMDNLRDLIRRGLVVKLIHVRNQIVTYQRLWELYRKNQKHGQAYDAVPEEIKDVEGN